MNRKLLLTLTYCLVVTLAIVPFAFAKSPKGPSGPAEEPTDELIYGCYKKNNGQLRIVKDPGQCRPPEVPITWNQLGPVDRPGHKVSLERQEQRDRPGRKVNQELQEQRGRLGPLGRRDRRTSRTRSKIW